MVEVGDLPEIIRLSEAETGCSSYHKDIDTLI
jgi:hypothetical protein